jgi:hypothetical protein
VAAFSWKWRVIRPERARQFPNRTLARLRASDLREALYLAHTDEKALADHDFRSMTVGRCDRRFHLPETERELDFALIENGANSVIDAVALNESPRRTYQSLDARSNLSRYSGASQSIA